MTYWGSTQLVESFTLSIGSTNDFLLPFVRLIGSNPDIITAIPRLFGQLIRAKAGNLTKTLTVILQSNQQQLKPSTKVPQLIRIISHQSALRISSNAPWLQIKIDSDII